MYIRGGRKEKMTEGEKVSFEASTSLQQHQYKCVSTHVPSTLSAVEGRLQVTHNAERGLENITSSMKLCFIKKSLHNSQFHTA